MKRIAIVISSQGGQTEKIAESIFDNLAGPHAEVDVLCVELGTAPTAAALKLYDAVIIGAPVYYGEFSEMLVDWAWEHREQLNSMESGFFTVSLSAADPRPKARANDDRLLRKFIHTAGVEPRFVATFGGALAYTQYSFFKRCVLQSVAAAAGAPTDMSRDFDLTNWDKVSAFADAFQNYDMCSEFATVNRLATTPEPLWPIGLARTA